MESGAAEDRAGLGPGFSQDAYVQLCVLVCFPEFKAFFFWSHFSSPPHIPSAAQRGGYEKQSLNRVAHVTKKPEETTEAFCVQHFNESISFSLLGKKLRSWDNEGKNNFFKKILFWTWTPVIFLCWNGMPKFEVEVYAAIIHVCGTAYRKKCVLVSFTSFPFPSQLTRVIF